MIRSNLLNIAAVLSSLLVLTFIGFISYKFIKQNVPLTEYIMKDYYLYQRHLFYAYPMFGYYSRFVIYNGFYNLLTGNYTKKSCLPYHEKPSKKLELLSYGESRGSANYYFGIPFIPLSGNNICFNDYLKSNESRISLLLDNFMKKQLESEVSTSGLHIKANPKKFLINLSWKYEFDETQYKRKLTLENRYDFRLDVLSYDANLSELYCNVSKLFAFYEVKDPKDFIDKYTKLKPLCESLSVTNKFINCTVNKSRFIPYYIAYNISPRFNFTATLRYWCERFGGKLIGGDCKLPENAKGETYYDECFFDSNTIKVSSESEIEYSNYTYTFHVIEKIIPNDSDKTTIYYPVTEDSLITSAESSDVSSIKNYEKKILSDIDMYLANLSVKYFVYYGKKYIYKKYTCKVGYKKETTSCLSDPDEWINKSVDGFYKKDAHYNPSTSCSNPDCCDKHYYRCGNHTCCECIGWVVHYKQRVKYIDSTDNAFTLETFGCFEN